MLISVNEDGNGRTLKIKDNRHELEILGSRISLIRHEDRYLVKIPHELTFVSKPQNPHDSFAKIGNKATGKQALIAFSDYDKGYERYGRYVARGCIRIGCSVDDDIYVQSILLIPSCIQMDFENHIVSAHESIMFCYFNGHCLNGTEKFKEGDALECLNLRILFQDGFILVNQCENMYVSLEPYVFSPACDPLPQKSPLRRQRRPSTHVKTSWSIDLMEPEHIAQLENRSLLFAIGPALMMSGASLTTGILSAYRSYLEGKELMDMLPMILLPFMMLLSSLLWNPLARIVEKKRQEQARKERNDEYDHYLSLVKGEMDCFEEDYRRDVDLIAPEETVLNQWLEKGIVDKKEEPVLLRLGYSNSVLSYSLNQGFRFRKFQQELEMAVAQLRMEATKPRYVPWVVNVNEYGSILIECDDSMVFYVLMQMMCGYAPENLAICIFTDSAYYYSNKWLSGIPHCYCSNGKRLIALRQKDVVEIRGMLACEHRGVVIVRIGDKGPTDESLAYPRIIFNDPSAECRLHVFPGGEGKAINYSDGTVIALEPLERLDARCEKVISSFAGETTFLFQAQDPSFLDLFYALTPSGLSIADHWQAHRANDGLLAVIGLDEKGHQVVLDLHEKVHGPHGLIAGTTGSGKSELIITLILSLAVSYSPREVQFVLIDFKGGGIGQVFASSQMRLPHVAGTLSNLEVDEMKRALVWIGAECRRRQLLIRQMGELSGNNIMNIADYRQTHCDEFNLPYLPDLVIVVDEFAELKKQRPDFLDQLISVARTGRSLGIHLILVTQKPGGVVSEQIWSNSRFKICLKVSEKQDSMDMLHNDSALSLQRPGQFKMLADGVMYSGVSGYANMRKPVAAPQVEILDHMGTVVKSTLSTTARRPPEMQGILEEIQRVHMVFPGLRLAQEITWVLPPEAFGAETLDQAEEPAVGLIDDYYHNRHEFLCLSQKIRLFGVFSPYRKEKYRFLKAILYSLLNHVKENDEIFIVDDLESQVSSLVPESASLGDVLRSDETEKVKNLLSYLHKRQSEDKGTTWLVVTDTTSFLDGHDERREDIHELIEHAENHALCIILMASAPSILNYRDLSLLAMKISLMNNNLQDIQALFQTGEKETASKEWFGLIRKDHLLSFRMADVTDEKLAEAGVENKRRLPCFAPYHIPCMPLHVRASECGLQGMALGICREDYEWRAKGENEKLAVVAGYEEDFELLTVYCQNHQIPCIVEPTEEWLKEHDGESDTIRFLTLGKWKSILDNHLLSSHSILFVGEGYNSQYTIQTKIKKIGADEGVLIRRGKGEVIKVVDSE